MPSDRVVEYDAYGPIDVLMLRELAMPDVGRRQLLIRVKATSINPKDTFVRKGRFRAITGEAFPRRTGYDFAGIIEDVGEEAADFSAGQAVFGMLNGFDGGACADLVVASVDEIAPMPESLSYAESAAIPLAALTALQALRDMGGVGSGASVCVNGASGGVGLFAVQIAKAMGAHVTAIASLSNEELCRKAGADAFVGYTTADGFPASETPYDVVFDVFGNRSLDEARGVMTDAGIYISTVPSSRTMMDAQATTGIHGPKAKLIVVESRSADLALLAAMVAKGQLKPHLDATFPIEAVRDAHRHVEGKHTRGKVVVLVD